MKPSAFLFYLPGVDYPSLGGNSSTSKIKLDANDTVSGDLHFLNSPRPQLIKELRKLADELEKVTPEQFKLPLCPSN